MKRRLWVIPTVVALGSLTLWLVFTLAVWSEGLAEPAGERAWRTAYFLTGILALVMADRLRGLR